jgi:hypothetical protein
MTKYFADINVQLRVYFEDDGENDITDQAMELAEHSFTLNGDDTDYLGLEMVGKPEQRKTEAPR